MSSRVKQLQALERLSRLKADLELRRFSAFRAHVQAVQAKAEGMRAELAEAAAAPPGAAVADWRAAHALVGYRAGALRRAEADLDRMSPGLAAAQQAAARAFGRTEALNRLQEGLATADRATRARRMAGE